MEYAEFLDKKKMQPVISGFNPENLNDNLFDFQRVIVAWALRRGRAAIFADTGLGKTLMQTSWADAVCNHTGGNVLIVAPLCVAHQTVSEAKKFGIDVIFTVISIVRSYFVRRLFNRLGVRNASQSN
jgi:reverse gyrase